MQEVVVLFFVADGGGVAVARINGEGIGEAGEFLEGTTEDAGIAAGQIGASDRAAEEGIADE